MALRSPRLHAHAGLEARDHVGARGVAAIATSGELGTVGISAAEVEEVDARKGYEEAAEERESVDHVVGVEATEKDEGSAEGGRGEGDVVKRVDATQKKLAGNGRGNKVGIREQRIGLDTYMLAGNWLRALLK